MSAEKITVIYSNATNNVLAALTLAADASVEVPLDQLVGPALLVRTFDGNNGELEFEVPVDSLSTLVADVCETSTVLSDPRHYYWDKTSKKLLMASGETSVTNNASRYVRVSTDRITDDNGADRIQVWAELCSRAATPSFATGELRFDASGVGSLDLDFGVATAISGGRVLVLAERRKPSLVLLT